MSGFEPESSGDKCDCSVNCSTATAIFQTSLTLSRVLYP